MSSSTFPASAVLKLTIAHAVVTPHVLRYVFEHADGRRATLASALGVDPACPFVSHAFLEALERSGCVGARTGWAPAHVLVEDGAGTLLACAPAYLKTHSQGEYVFDFAWADAYERAGGRYYPKVQVSVPFTPATGPRLLVRPGERVEEARRTLVAGLKTLRAQAGASSVHLTFLPRADWERLGGEPAPVITPEEFARLQKAGQVHIDSGGRVRTARRRNEEDGGVSLRKRRAWYAA